MFLFLHGITETNSSLVPLIKSVFDLEHGEYSDKYLLDTFTIQIPGFDGKDANFEFEVIEKLIREFAESQVENQTKLSQELILCKNQSAFDALKENKLNIVGNGIGAGISMQFATKNPELISSIIAIECGSKFSGFRHYFRNRHLHALQKKNVTELQKRMNGNMSIEDQKIASILLENPEQKGFVSYFKLMKKFDFSNQFHRLSINQQNKFSNIPMLFIIAKNRSCISESHIKSLYKLINPTINLSKNKSTIISFDEDYKRRFYYEVVDNKSPSLLEVQNLNLVTNCITKFLDN